MGEKCALRERGSKKSTPKSTAKFKSEFGSFAAKIHAARIWPPVVFFLRLGPLGSGTPWNLPEILNLKISSGQIRWALGQPRHQKLCQRRPGNLQQRVARVQ